MMSHAYLSLGYPYLQQGKLPDAIRLFEQNIEMVRDRKVLALIPMGAAWLGCAFAVSGRLAEGLALVDDAVATAGARGWPSITGTMAWLSSEAWLLAGRVESAADIVRRALAHSRDQHMRGHEAQLSWLLARITASREPLDFEHSKRIYREALALALDLGMRPLVAHCHLGIAMLYRRTAQRDLAREHLTTAATMYREMDMRFWLDQAVTIEIPALRRHADAPLEPRPAGAR